MSWFSFLIPTPFSAEPKDHRPPFQPSNHRRNGGSICRRTEVNDLPGGVRIVKAAVDGADSDSLVIVGVK